MLTPDEARKRLLRPPNLNVGRWHEVPVRMPGVGFKGFFTVRLIDARTGLVKRRLSFPNLITDAGLDAIGEDAGTDGRIDELISRMAVGTGSTTPNVSDTSLVSEVARTADSAGIGNGLSSGPSFDYWEWEISFQFDQGEANANLTELGLFSNDAGGPMWARQLLQDAGGSPTTITKTSDDILQIVYTLRVYPDKSVRTSNLTIDGTSTTLSRQPQEVDVANEWGRGGTPADRGMLYQFGVWAGSDVRVYEDNTPPGDFVSRGPANPATSEDVGAGGYSFAAYTGGTFQRDLEVIASVNEGNFAGGVGAVEGRINDVFTRGHPFITFFDPPIPKADTDELTLQIRYSWGRHTIP